MGSTSTPPRMAVSNHQMPSRMVAPSIDKEKLQESSSRCTTVPSPGFPTVPMCMNCGCCAPWMLCPSVMRIFCLSFKSSHIHFSLLPSGSRRPSASYGTKARLSFGSRKSPCFGTDSPSFCNRTVSKSSDLPNKRNVIVPSTAVCCKLMHTVPRDPRGPSSKDRSAQLLATWSAFSPPKLVPKTRTRSAVSASFSIHGNERSCKVPEYLTTGLQGSYQLPWISLMPSCGKPAF
mmetsp:Transcript_82589/g.207829  ORF Transcript_82589/g.207829 Transcript_82589/m.207829 type:complete len:233 (-) Transcript_82589:814-1512(-)